MTEDETWRQYGVLRSSIRIPYTRTTARRTTDEKNLEDCQKVQGRRENGSFIYTVPRAHQIELGELYYEPRQNQRQQSF